MCSDENPPYSMLMAVKLNDCIAVFGGILIKHRKVIWTYKLYIEKWRKYVAPDGSEVIPSTQSSCAAAIGKNIYVYSGSPCWEIWKLSKTTNDCFVWTKVIVQDKGKGPSVRTRQLGWGYDEKLWIFGGKGLSPKDYLNENGDFKMSTKGLYDSVDWFYNNQLLCFDPSSCEWSNPKCFGDVPTPREYCGPAKIRDRVWVKRSLTADGLYELDMRSFSWTKIDICMVQPEPRFSFSLTAVTGNHLILHGGADIHRNRKNTTWIFDIQSHSWRQYGITQDEPRAGHTGTPGLNDSVIAIGGFRFDEEDIDGQTLNLVHTIMLEPKSLQQYSI